MSKQFITVRNGCYWVVGILYMISNCKVFYEWNWSLVKLFNIQVNSQSPAFTTVFNVVIDAEPYLTAIFSGVTITLLTCLFLIDLGDWLSRNVSWLRWIA